MTNQFYAKEGGTQVVPLSANYVFIYLRIVIDISNCNIFDGHTTLSIMTLSIMTLSIKCDTQNNDNQHNDIQHNGIQHNDTHHKMRHSA
jgi:hypothetical protein